MCLGVVYFLYDVEKSYELFNFTWSCPDMCSVTQANYLYVGKTLHMR